MSLLRKHVREWKKHITSLVVALKKSAKHFRLLVSFMWLKLNSSFYIIFLRSMFESLLNHLNRNACSLEQLFNKNSSGRKIFQLRMWIIVAFKQCQLHIDNAGRVHVHALGYEN